MTHSWSCTLVMWLTPDSHDLVMWPTPMCHVIHAGWGGPGRLQAAASRPQQRSGDSSRISLLPNQPGPSPLHLLHPWDHIKVIKYHHPSETESEISTWYAPWRWIFALWKKCLPRFCLHCIDKGQSRSLNEGHTEVPRLLFLILYSMYLQRSPTFFFGRSD